LVEPPIRGLQSPLKSVSPHRHEPVVFGKIANNGRRVKKRFTVRWVARVCPKKALGAKLKALRMGRTSAEAQREGAGKFACEGREMIPASGLVRQKRYN